LPIGNWRLPIAKWPLFEFVIGSSLAMNAAELRQRSKTFSLRVLKLVGALPNNVQGRAIGSQLIRSGMSVGANYRAACKARSKAEFVAKIGVVEEEADESVFWMELIVESGMLREKVVESLLLEARQLAAIMARSRITAASSLKRKR
jgi:four helix bundle protein